MSNLPRNPISYRCLFLVALLLLPVGLGLSHASETRDGRAIVRESKTILSGAKTLAPADLPPLGPPVAADTAPVLDATFSANVALWAGAIGPDPVALYNFVHDSIETDVYFGSLKGASGCLAEGKGNDFDQASLLIALLRFHNIPARYQYGTLKMTLDQVQELALTNVSPVTVENYGEITTALGSMGIPIAAAIDENDFPVYIVVDQCWVRAYVPSGNYRGRPGRAGSAGDWLYLYPGFKHHEYGEPAADLAGLVRFDPDEFFTSAPLDTLPLDYYRNKLFDYIEDNGIPCPTLDAAMIQRKIIQEKLDVLPAALPAAIVVGGSQNIPNPVTWSAIPDAFRHKLRLEATYPGPGGGLEATGIGALTLTIPEVYGKKIAVEWSGLSGSDQETIDVLKGRNPVPLGVSVQVTGAFTVDDIARSAGVPLELGTGMKLRADQLIPNYPLSGVPDVGSRTAITGLGLMNLYDLSAGGAAAVVLAPNEAADSVYQDHLQRLSQLIEGGASSQRIRTQELQVRGLEFLREVALGETVFAGIHHVNFRHFWYAVEQADQLTEPGILGGGGGDGGSLIDFRATTGTFSIKGDPSLDFEVTQAIGHNGSGLEFSVLAKYQNETCVSYTNVIQRAAQQGTGYITVDASNVGTFRSQLVDIPADIMQTIENHVISDPAKNFARVPREQITVNRWTGFAYLLSNTVDGAGAYRLNGEYE